MTGRNAQSRACGLADMVRYGARERFVLAPAATVAFAAQHRILRDTSPVPAFTGPRGNRPARGADQDPPDNHRED